MSITPEQLIKRLQEKIGRLENDLRLIQGITDEKITWDPTGRIIMRICDKALEEKPEQYEDELLADMTDAEYGAGGEVMKEKIFCCPFCGSLEVEICRTNKNACWVRCANCGADAPSHETRKDAIESWNHRFHSDSYATIVYDMEKEP